jgi:uncharacterized protein YceK
MHLKPRTGIIVLLLVVASLFVSGCTQTTTQNASSPSPTQSPAASGQTTTQATATVGNSNITLIIEDPAEEVINHMQVSANATTVPQQILTDTPKSGYEFVGFNCTVKNIDAAPNQETSGSY